MVEHWCVKSGEGIVRCTVDIRSLRGSFNSGRVLGNVSLRTTGNRMATVVNPDKSNGAALLHDVGLLRAPSSNIVAVNKIDISYNGGVGRTSTLTLHHRATVIFRSCGLFGGGATLRGVARNLHAMGGGSATRTSRVTHGRLRLINLSSFTSCCPVRLSNNRRRHISVTQTLTLGPATVLFSRPASTLSPRLINSILRTVNAITGLNVAVIVIARRVHFTHGITSGIVFIGRNIVIRRNATRRIVSRPARRHAGTFLDHVGSGWSTSNRHRGQI